MTEAEKSLYASLGGGDSLELLAGGKSSISSGVGASIAQIMNNPQFKAEISFNFSVKFYSQAVVGTAVEVLAAALPAGQKTTYPLFLFGNTDYQGSYAKARQLLPNSSWDLTKMALIQGGDMSKAAIRPLGSNIDYTLGSIVNNRVQAGDLLIAIPMVGFVAGAAGTTVIAEILIRCTNVAYLTLLNALSSDLITLNMIRYTVDTTQTSQLQNQILIIMQSLFGKAATDTLDPNTFVTGQTYNRNIADIPLTLPVDKNLVLATNVNFDVVSFSWTCTVSKIDKLAYGRK
jgi:hypothetical protein